MANKNARSATRPRVTVVLSDQRRDQLEKIAYELSEPGDSVTTSELLREAMEDYVAKFEANPESCSPRKRGKLANKENRPEDGVA